jgi:hypothetical protein
VKTVEPTMIGMAAFMGFAKGDHVRLLFVQVDKVNVALLFELK